MWIVVYELVGIPDLLCPTVVDLIIVDVAGVRLIEHSLWFASVRRLTATMHMLKGRAATDRPVPDTVIRCVGRCSVHRLGPTSTFQR
jgi:hypothetical protein